MFTVILSLVRVMSLGTISPGLIAVGSVPVVSFGGISISLIPVMIFALGLVTVSAASVIFAALEAFKVSNLAVHGLYL